MSMTRRVIISLGLHVFSRPTIADCYTDQVELALENWDSYTPARNIELLDEMIEQCKEPEYYMPSDGRKMSSGIGRTHETGHPKRDRSKNKAARKARRNNRR